MTRVLRWATLKCARWLTTELPSGTVTFLFTDIEGSTALLKQLRERYAEVLAEHQALLRDAVAAQGGEVVDTQGDSYFCAFRRAKQAVVAAADAQRWLAAHGRPEGVELRVRMGIHTGEAELEDDRYHRRRPCTGQPVSVMPGTAARCCAANDP